MANVKERTFLCSGSHDAFRIIDILDDNDVSMADLKISGTNRSPFERAIVFRCDDKTFKRICTAANEAKKLGKIKDFQLS